MGLNNAKEEYNALILRIFIISSIIAQILLFLCSFVVRKGNPSGSIRRIVWAVIFLGADSIAAFSLGNIFQNSVSPFQSQGTKATKTDDPEFNKLLALWATSILLHLGGHSTITSFSWADNEYWWILLLLRFIFHVLTTITICILSFMQGGVSSSVMVLLVVGIFKFGERVFALNRGSIRRLIRSARKNSNPGPICLHSQPPEGIQLPRKPRVAPRVASLFEAYDCFDNYKEIYIDHTISSPPANQNRFSEKSIDDCIKLLEMELGFAYDMFYSKSIVMHNILGCVLRVISFIMIVFAYVLFFKIEKHKLSEIDGHVTNALLLKAGVLEFLSFMLSLMSSHTLVKTRNLEGSIWRGLENIIVSCHSFIERIFRPSIKVGQFNLVSYCSRDCKFPEWLSGFLENSELKEFFDSCYYVHRVPLDERKKTLLFDQVRSRSDNRQHGQNTSTEQPISKLYESLERSFEERLLIYHIATELCHYYQSEKKDLSEHLIIAKFLSDYMLYLLVVHPSLLSSVLTVELRSYGHTRAAALEFLSQFRNARDYDPYGTLRDQYADVVVLETNKFERSMLSEGIRVAHELLDESKLNKWKLLFQLWVEMLCLAASQSKGKNHARQLAKGKELFTIIWLYMIHLGMSYQHVLQTETDMGKDIIIMLVTADQQQVENNDTQQALQEENNNIPEVEEQQNNNTEDPQPEGNNNSNVTPLAENNNVPTSDENDRLGIVIDG